MTVDTGGVDTDRLVRELETLAEFSDAPAPAVTRVVYSEMDRRAREYVKGLCAGAGARSTRAIVRAPSMAAINAAALEDARAGVKPQPEGKRIGPAVR